MMRCQQLVHYELWFIALLKQFGFGPITSSSFLICFSLITSLYVLLQVKDQKLKLEDCKDKLKRDLINNQTELSIPFFWPSTLPKAQPVLSLTTSRTLLHLYKVNMNKSVYRDKSVLLNCIYTLMGSIRGNEGFSVLSTSTCDSIQVELNLRLSSCKLTALTTEPQLPTYKLTINGFTFILFYN